jgi:uncharacterized protein YjbI with pentapeptide repeats
MPRPLVNAEELVRRYRSGVRRFASVSLAGANLVGVELQNASLKEANLADANLVSAQLGGVNLQRAYLSQTKLARADLKKANLAHANLVRANLAGASLTGADLQRANLGWAILEGANLEGANLEGADLDLANLDGTNLARAHLRNADLRNARLKKVNLEDANLVDVNLEGASLEGANLEGASLAGANLEGANLTGAYLGSADLFRARLVDATCTAITLGDTRLIATSLTCLCNVLPTIRFVGPCSIDHESIQASIRSPNLKGFLQKSGMPEVFIEYMLDCAKSLTTDVFRMFKSTFISFGSPDEPFARKLYEALHKNGVTTFFFPEHAIPGEKLHRLMRKGVNEHDRVILVCSKASLVRNGVLNEIEETLTREAKDGGASYLIPIRLDNYIFSGWNPTNPDIAQAVQSRVVADFEGADVDQSKFDAALLRLIAALKK